MKLPERIKQVEEDRIDAYKKHRNKVGEALLRATMRGLAVIEATDNVNKILENRLGLYGVRLDGKEMIARVNLVVRTEVAAILAEHSILPKEAIAEFTRRIVAQALPTKDDVMVPTNPSVPERRRIEALEDAIKREMQRANNKREK